MSHNPSPEFSFDIYPGLDAELDEIYKRNTGLDATPDQPNPDGGLPAAVGNALAQQTPEVSLSQEANDWATSEILNSRLVISWGQHSAELGTAIPDHLDDLNPTSIERLYSAREALKTSGEVTPEGIEIAETMHLVLVPWKAMRDNIGDFSGWVKKIRTTQGTATNDDYFNENILKAIQEETGGLYRDPKNPGNLLSAKRYLDMRIEEDGDWGMMLAQTSDQAGIDSLVQGAGPNRTPNALTNDGSAHFEIAGQQVDAMGVFEWIALTIQEHPNELSKTDVSWLLANRMTVNGVTCVPYGDWDDGQVESNLYDASGSDDDVRPRLAVI